MKPSLCASIVVGLGCYFSVSWGVIHLAEAANLLTLGGAIPTEKAYAQSTPKHSSFSLFSFFFFLGRKIALGTVRVFSSVFFFLLSAFLVFSLSWVFLFLLPFLLMPHFATCPSLARFTWPPPCSPEGHLLLRVCQDSILSLFGSEHWAYAVTAEQSVATAIQNHTVSCLLPECWHLCGCSSGRG